MLLRAVARVWKARERGRLLEKVRAVREVKNAWIIWHTRLREQKQLQGPYSLPLMFSRQYQLTVLADLALTFSMRSNVHMASSTLQTWYRVYASHRNALSFAMQYHSAQLRFKMLLTWRLQLRAKLQMIKQSRIAEKFFIARQAWKIWTDKLEEKRRQKKLQDWKKQKMRKCFICEFKLGSPYC